MSLKKIILSAFSYFISGSAIAQFHKGEKMAGADIASFIFNSGGADVSFPQVRGYSSKTTNYALSIEPAFGWFISDKTVIGGTFILKPTSQKTRYEDAGTTFQEDRLKGFNIGAGLFARNYFGGGAGFLPFAQAGINAGVNSSSSEGFKYYDSTPDYKITYDGKSSGGFFANATVLVGMTKLVGNHTGLDVYVGYNYSYNKNTFKTTTLTDLDLDGDIDFRSENEPTTKFTNHGLVVAVGFQVFLGSK
jgi:hypothetical protein